MVPMDSRCVASPTSQQDYVFYAQGGWSWCVPYLAGLYALACQVKPTVTPEEFWSVGLETGKTITIDKDGKTYQLGKIVDPVALLRRAVVLQSFCKMPRDFNKPVGPAHICIGDRGFQVSASRCLAPVTGITFQGRIPAKENPNGASQRQRQLAIPWSGPWPPT